MDFSMNSLCAYQEAGKGDCSNLYPTFAAPTPINLSKSYTGNTLTPGVIPSPLNFPSITPPSSPFSYYGLYSPTSTPRVSPMYDPTYLKRLKSNPMFRDLQTLLRQECMQMQVPANLITTSWNLMELHKPTNDKPGDAGTVNQNSSLMMPPPTSTGVTNQNGESSRSANENKANSGQQVYMCHMKLQDKLLKVRIDPAISADGLSVENDYSKEVGNIEMERYRALNSCPDEKVKETINSYYDKQRIKLADKTEEKLDELIEKAEEMRRNAQHNNINKTLKSSSPVTNESVKQTSNSQPESNQGASLLLAPVEDKLNAVRKLKFNTSDENLNEDNNNNNNNHKEVNDDDDDDYLNCSVNSEDFEIDEIDVETVDRHSDTNENSVDRIPSMKNVQEDLLKQCIQESGLGSLNSIPTQNNNEHCHGTTGLVSNNSHSDQSICDSTLPDSSTSSSPISLPSPVESTNQNSSLDLTNQSASIEECSPSTNISFQSEEFHQKQPVNFDFGQFFSTPHSNNYKFTQPGNLNSALSAMQKLCGGPSVTFTPELRRDISATALTPEIPKQSPSYDGYSPMNYNSVTNMNTNMASMRQMTGAHHEQQRMASTNQRSCGPPNVTVLPNKSNQDTKNNNVNMNNSSNRKNVDSSTNKSIKTDEFKFENTPVFKTHRMLTAESTNILSQWYHNHVQYPYPNDQEVEELSKLTGITGRQVKKWMANKRVRCFNTLSITGNQHPIKYKYQGKGRKRKTTETEKENCDSTTMDPKGNYSMLSDKAKDMLNQWYENHLSNPYPTPEEKDQLASMCGITISQVKSWFANKRNRTNNTKRQVPNYFIEKFPEYSHIVHYVGQKREEERMLKRRKVNEIMYIQPPFYI